MIETKLNESRRSYDFQLVNVITETYDECGCFSCFGKDRLFWFMLADKTDWGNSITQNGDYAV